MVGQAICGLPEFASCARRVDRRKPAHGRTRGKFDQCAGVIIGECVDCGPRQFEPSITFNYTLGEVLDRVFEKVKVPVFHGLLIGHTPDQITLPIGVMASMDADRKELIIEEAAVS